ncbi:hypothetical protein [Fictibacillus sp. FJAT-27399]|uniref:hypothetical protein n=1 Tax=Fictibacillus sp. FJAT-27399 TaxID=1729689 RepID=UPI000781B8FF|nr:hypothetical protein [Fictibacillus sp. FJAT-27399]
MRMARVGVYLDKERAIHNWGRGENVFECYCSSLFQYAGIPFTPIEETKQLHHFDIVVLALPPLKLEETEDLWDYIHSGGSVISFGTLGEFARRMGLKEYLIDGGYGVYNQQFLRFFHAFPWTASPSLFHCQKSGEIKSGSREGRSTGALLEKWDIGKGILHRWTVDIIGAIVGMQQGREPVTKDGPPAPDGTANLDDGLLKADDGFAMDWEMDRLRTSTGQPYFSVPYADLWKEAMISHLMKTVLDQGLTLPFLDYWPDGIEQLAMVSHDSDVNDDESAYTTLAILEECDIHSTWCMMEPGYSPAIYPVIRQKGHEIALHYNARKEDGGSWSNLEMERQLHWLHIVSSVEPIISNKNHYTIFQNWGELFEWCESIGIQSDQTRGPSKKGNVGFLFGTCHPYFPIAWADKQNRIYDVLEIGFLTQDVDLSRLADTSIIKPFLTKAKEVRGVAHFLFHQIHLHREPTVKEALKQVVRQAKEMGYHFWTGDQINEWVRRRTRMKIQGIMPEGEVEYTDGCLGAVICIPVKQKENSGTYIERFGVYCKKQKVEAGTEEMVLPGKETKFHE